MTGAKTSVKTATIADCQRAGRALQRAIIAFFTLTVALLLALYAVAPSIYVQTLMLDFDPADAHPLAINVFLVALLLFIATIVVGVIRRWRWLYWLVIIAFLAAPLEIPAGILQLMGILPIQQPAWYVLLRMATAVVECALGVWMLLVWRRCGVWAQGRMSHTN